VDQTGSEVTSKSSDKPKKQQKQKPQKTQKTLKERRSEKRAAKKFCPSSLLPADK
jgi:ribosomal protein S4